MDATLILASQSPRRQELLAALGLAFSIEVADVDETPWPAEAADDMVIRLSRAKVAAVAARRPTAIVLAADTTVALNGALLGKPTDAAEATAMLRALRGSVHQVYTAVSVGRNSVVTCALSRSDVWMRSYSDRELAAYVATGDPLDKAGAYAIQHPTFAPVERWEGCFAGIMGLPLGIAADLLAAVAVPMISDVAQVCETMSGGPCCLRRCPRHGRLA